MTAPPYENRVAAALATFLHSKSRVDMHNLAHLLGHHNSTIGPETPADEVVARTAWVTVLRRYDRSTAAATYTEQCMLAGLLPNDRWKTLFECEKDAYAFVIVLARYLRKEEARKVSPFGGETYRAMRIQIQSAMASWFSLDIEPGALTLRDLGCAFFGDAWVSLVYDSRSDKITLSQLVDATRPPFLPGRLAMGSVQEAAILPAIEC